MSQSDTIQEESYLLLRKAQLDTSYQQWTELEGVCGIICGTVGRTNEDARYMMYKICGNFSTCQNEAHISAMWKATWCSPSSKVPSISICQRSNHETNHMIKETRSLVSKVYVGSCWWHFSELMNLVYPLYLSEENECSSDAHDCEQICMNTDGGFECDCLDGYTLNDDGKTCQGRLHPMANDVKIIPVFWGDQLIQCSI